MIKISNAKSIKEINELRDKGLYNAPFSVQEQANKIVIKADTKELEEDIKDNEEASAMAIVEIYEAIDMAKKEIEKVQSQAIIEIYETMGGLNE